MQGIVSQIMRFLRELSKKANNNNNIKASNDDVDQLL